jgi:hypothetical protein
MGQYTVAIDGEQAGVLIVDQTSSSDEITHTVPEAGTYSYTIEAIGRSQDAYGSTYQLTGNGQGDIQVEQGSSYEIRGKIGGDTWQVFLVEG